MAVSRSRTRPFACLLLALSGLRCRSLQVPLSGANRTCSKDGLMSANDPKQTLQSCLLSHLLAYVNAVSAAPAFPVIGETKFFCLNWRARHRTVRAIDAAIAFPRLHLQTATNAFINILAGVRWHVLGLSMPAFRAGYGRLQFNQFRFPRPDALSSRPRLLLPIHHRRS